MHIKPSKIVPIFLRYGVALFLFATLIVVAVSEDFRTVKEPYSWDEHLYKNISNNFTVEHIQYAYNNVMESKPLTFLVLQKVLNHSDPLFTRGFAYLLFFVCTYLIYKITNDNKFAFLFILIPISLDSMWLTAEILEVTFVLLSIRYANRSGIFIGIAMLFRPIAILYLVLLKKVQMLYVFIIGVLFAGVLFALGLFYPYLFEVRNYAVDGFVGIDFFVIIVLVMLFIVGINKRMLGYVIITTLSFGIKMYPHYFLPIYTFLFVGFLLNMDEDMKDINW